MRIRLSAPQRRVLEWLLAYPTVRIVLIGAPFATEPYLSGPDSYASFTAYWQSPAARKDMNAIAGDVLGLPEVQPYLVDLDGPTPRVTRRIFNALYRRGLLDKVAYSKGSRYVCSNHYYSTNELSSAVLLEHPERETEEAAA